ncbi:MAG TPA: GNAT family N-acetyltransferase [Trebonia sp.]|nr:GNAT family N-acetyltransferase [Trebonia sp.]
MTELEIRPVSLDDDFEAQLDLGQRAFGPYSEQQKVSWLYVARLRASQGLFLGVFAGGVPAGAAMLHDMRQYWLGRPVPCGGVASVKVAPEQRGRGIGRALMTRLLELTAERGYLLSALYPATMPIYRSLGWELAGAKYEFNVPARSLRELAGPDPQAAAAHPPAPPVRRVSPVDAAAMIGVTARSHLAARDAGAISWDEGPARQWLSRPDLYAYLAGDGPRDGAGDAAADGFAAYRWANGGELFVERVHAATPGALRALWSVIASNASVARTVRGWTAPSDPLWWLTRERDAALSRRSMWMLRVVDVPAAIAARGFPPAVSVSVPVELSDQARRGNAGSWQLTVAEGQGALTPNEAGSSPGALTLGPRGVAALYAGTPLATLRMAGLVSGGVPSADAALDAAFAATPYMVDDF